jgi:hypothetical protein
MPEFDHDPADEANGCAGLVIVALCWLVIAAFAAGFWIGSGC